MSDELCLPWNDHKPRTMRYVTSTNSSERLIVGPTGTVVVLVDYAQVGAWTSLTSAIPRELITMCTFGLIALAIVRCPVRPVAWGAKFVGLGSSGLVAAFVLAAAGYFHTGGIRAGSGEISCWGSNNSGQASPPSGSFTAISSYHMHSCATRVDGRVMCGVRTRKARAPHRPCASASHRRMPWAHLVGGGHDCVGRRPS